MNKPYITVTNGISGHYAILVVWDDELQGWDIEQTGLGRYPTVEEATAEGLSWAESEQLEFK